MKKKHIPEKMFIFLCVSSLQFQQHNLKQTKKSLILIATANEMNALFSSRLRTNLIAYHPHSICGSLLKFPPRPKKIKTKNKNKTNTIFTA